MESETTENENESKEKHPAKTLSLVAKIVGALVVLVGAVLKWLGIFSNCEVSELCLVGFSIMGIFGTVDINLALDKFLRK